MAGRKYSQTGMPFSEDAEASVLSACLLNQDAADAAVSRLRPEDFYREPHRHIFQAVAKLRSKGMPADQLTAYEVLMAMGSNVRRVDLVNICDNTFALTNWQAHIEIVAKHSLQRKLIHFAARLRAAAESSFEDMGALQDEAVRRVEELLGCRLVPAPMPPEDGREEMRTHEG